MSSTAKVCLILCFVLLASATIALGRTDPELKQCKDKCGEQRYFGKEQERCIQRCEDYHREKERQHGGGNVVDPQKEYQQCSVQCSRQSEGSKYSQERCESDCKRQLREREQEQGRKGTGRDDIMGKREGEQEQKGEQWRESPYVFEDRHFITGMQTQHGRIRMLPKFTERSELLRGIENYRVSIFEAEPQTFVVPNHWDADAVFFVTTGRGTVSLVRQDRKESFNIKQGDIVRIKAGTTSYLINRDNNQKLILAKLIIPVNTPGRYQAYFGAGGDNPESFYSVFSNEVLEAAFNTRSDKLKRLFGQQKQGFIIKASEEQIRALSQHEEGGIWPFGGGETRGTFNLYQQRPTHSNQYGQLYEVDSSQFRQLRDLDLAISLANITQGGMAAPYYNSKATKISVVVEGEGYFEMACPHVSESKSESESQERGSSRWGEKETKPIGGPRYQRVSSRLKRGTVVVVPAGHPFVAVASNNQNLQLLCFEINARDNEKFPLAGRRNVMNQIEREAKELAFGLPAREVDEVFKSQQEEFFFKGPRQQREGRADA